MTLRMGRPRWAIVKPSTFSATAGSRGGPGRKRRCRRMTSDVMIFRGPLSAVSGSMRRQMPSPGAVCPAMVRNGCRTSMRLRTAMVPPVRKTTVRGPLASQAARRLPGPESSRWFTARVRPPRPPMVPAPNPSAPGNAGGGDDRPTGAATAAATATTSPADGRNRSKEGCTGMAE